MAKWKNVTLAVVPACVALGAYMMTLPHAHGPERIVRPPALAAGPYSVLEERRRRCQPLGGLQRPSALRAARDLPPAALARSPCDPGVGGEQNPPQHNRQRGTRVPFGRRSPTCTSATRSFRGGQTACLSM